MSAYRFEQIIEEIKILAEEAEGLIPEHTRARARAYWIAQIAMITDNDHGYMGSCGVSMVDTLEEWHDSDSDD